MSKERLLGILIMVLTLLTGILTYHIALLGGYSIQKGSILLLVVIFCAGLLLVVWEKITANSKDVKTFIFPFMLIITAFYTSLSSSFIRMD
ncbi:hypothetical protein E2R51_08525 [Jeotgalibacillus sp. S-D1]|uniref:hypothetical protein n=1 Tax=Jeotgalibacillus sp. S-D1 TaxID=2552189 RepID=UPI001059D26C|nr:hypothetical protein [Jeotgalibacillus sp. S-D1]TDL32712.1 hypothetical protein E2R51_08525 [Jeotgalibacillus sp. S-D1]